MQKGVGGDTPTAPYLSITTALLIETPSPSVFNIYNPFGTFSGMLKRTLFSPVEIPLNVVLYTILPPLSNSMKFI